MGNGFDLSEAVGFEWDRGNLEHIKKHDVDYRECEEVFDNKPLLIVEDKDHSQIEERFEVLGLTDNKRLIFLVFTMRKGRIRVISARDQNKVERRKIKKVGGENL